VLPSSVFEAASFVSLFLVGIYLVCALFQRRSTLGIFIGPLAFSLVAATVIRARYSVPSFSSVERIVSGDLSSHWFSPHVLLTLIGYGFFALAACSSALYLIEEKGIKTKTMLRIADRFPSLEALDRITLTSVAVGFALLTGGLISGMMVSRDAWGAYWVWDPKILSSMICWGTYAVILQARFFRGIRGKKLALFNMVGFSTVFFTLVALHWLFRSMHTFV